MLKKLVLFLWNYLMTHKHFFLLLYAAIYIPWFMYVEDKVSANSNYHLIHMPIDDMIPFCEVFVVFYFLWFVYMAWGIILIGIRDGSTCWRMGIFLITGMTIFLIVSTVYPNGHDLRPDTFPRDNFFTHLVAWLYSTDTPTNLFPSIHVYNSMGVLLGLMHYKHFRHKPGMKLACILVAAGICLSTVFIKQHSMFDVITALLLSVVMYFVCFFRPKHYKAVREADKKNNH